jgi:hypothetical protein
MNRYITQPIVPAALFILLSAVFLPDTYNGFSAKQAYVDNPVTSPASLQDDELYKPNGDDQKIGGRHNEAIVLPPPQHTTPALNPAPAPDIASTVSQARAPPGNPILFNLNPFRTTIF